MKTRDAFKHQQEIDEVSYLANLLKREPTEDELLEFRSALFSLGKSIFKQYISQKEGRCDD